MYLIPVIESANQLQKIHALSHIEGTVLFPVIDTDKIP